jgi:predicted GNAT superfamily acetyltransferase
MPPSLFAQYINERLGKFCIENEHGFCVVKYFYPDFVYIEDVYVRPESRHQQWPRKFEQMVIEDAKSKGYKRLVGSVMIKATGAERSCRMMLESDYKFDSLVGTTIYFTKEI